MRIQSNMKTHMGPNTGWNTHTHTHACREASINTNTHSHTKRDRERHTQKDRGTEAESDRGSAFWLSGSGFEPRRPMSGHHPRQATLD